MRRFLIIAIPIATIVAFVMIMQSTRFLKKSFGENDGVAEIFDELFDEIDNENWEDISKGVEDLEVAWGIVVSRLQFSVERDEINNISNNIARLKGAVQAKDKVNVLMELYQAHNNWKNLDR